jgi:hypothetical protein
VQAENRFLNDWELKNEQEEPISELVGVFLAIPVNVVFLGLGETEFPSAAVSKPTAILVCLILSFVPRPGVETRALVL